MEFKAFELIGFQRLLSDLGQRIFLPQGVFYWSGRAAKEGKPGLNATIGSAFVNHSLLYPGTDDAFVIAHLPDAAAHFPHLSADDVFAYAPICGLPAFREAWRNWILYKGGDEYADIAGHLSLPIVTPGITGAISICARLFLNPGEKIVCPMQRWENYDTVLEANLGIGFEEYPHFDRGEFNIAGFLAAVERVLQHAPRAVAILNFPNNPTGYNPTQELVRERLLPAVCELVQRHDKPLVVLFDDAYEGYVYDGASMPVSPFYEFVNVDDRVVPVKLEGCSKELLWYGGRIGTITFGLCDEWLNEVSADALSKDLDNKIGGLIRGTVSNSPRPVQAVAAKLLAAPATVAAQRQITIDALQRRWQLARRALADPPPGVTPDPFQGGFFLFVNLDGINARAVAEHMIERHGVACVPAEYPAKNWNGLRLAYCGIHEDKVAAVFDALKAAVETQR